MYFDKINTIEEAKNLFRDLCKKLHPDTSSYNSQAEFIKMFKEFESFKPKKTQSKEQNEETENFNASEFYNLLRNFDILENIKIVFVGSFIWLEDLTPNATYLQRNQIKAINISGYNTARFAPVKKLWYFSPSNYRQFSCSHRSFDEIKADYGAKSFNIHKMYIA